MHILKVFFMTASFPAIHFFCDSVIISRERLKKSKLCFFHNTFCSHPLPTITICGWFEKKLKCMFISGKPLWPCSFKGAYLFHRTSCNNFFLKSTVLNAQKHLQRSHSFMVNQHSEITFTFLTKHSAVSKG